LAYDAYTDIEFNPKKSYNCQAHSAALYKSAKLREIDVSVVRSPSAFKRLFNLRKQDPSQIKLDL
jgi:hypothetical protein